MDLTGRKALVTGGAGHIGLAVCQTLVEMGANVAVLDYDEAVCKERAADLEKSRKDCAIPVACDLKDEENTRQAVRKTVQELGGLDILIHCAAYVGTTDVPGWNVPFKEQSVDTWDDAFRVNLTSAFTMVQEARDPLAAGGKGSIIFFISTYGLVGPVPALYEGLPMTQPAAYAASKGGLVQFMRWLSTTLAPEVRVNSVTPGGVLRGQPEPFLKRYEARTPMGRMANEEDMKGAIAYLSSDLSAYVTGHNLVVDGGWTAW